VVPPPTLETPGATSSLEVNTAEWLTHWSGTGHHALAPMAAALMGARDPCLGEDSNGCKPIAGLAKLVLVDQHEGLVADSMGTSLYCLQVAIIANNDILKN
jgi:hypothetical protein